jgi:hypothetical protein
MRRDLTDARPEAAASNENLRRFHLRVGAQDRKK